MSAIASVLGVHPDVAEVAVVTVDGQQVAVVRPRLHCTAVDLRDDLWDAVPADQLPDAVVVLPELPGDPTTLSTKALAEAGACGFAPPTTPTERGLAAIWSEVLGRKRVAAGDNFLDLGGDSMTATLLLDLGNERFGVALTIDELLDLPSLRAVAGLVDERRQR